MTVRLRDAAQPPCAHSAKLAGWPSAYSSTLVDASTMYSVRAMLASSRSMPHTLRKGAEKAISYSDGEGHVAVSRCRLSTTNKYDSSLAASSRYCTSSMQPGGRAQKMCVRNMSPFTLIGLGSIAAVLAFVVAMLVLGLVQERRAATAGAAAAKNQ